MRRQFGCSPLLLLFLLGAGTLSAQAGSSRYEGLDPVDIANQCVDQMIDAVQQSESKMVAAVDRFIKLRDYLQDSRWARRIPWLAKRFERSLKARERIYQYRIQRIFYRHARQLEKMGEFQLVTFLEQDMQFFVGQVTVIKEEQLERLNAAMNN